MSIQPGDRVEARGASGQWHAALAVTGVEDTHGDDGRKIHDFPVVWVTFQGKVRDRGVPWPAEDVRRYRADIGWDDWPEHVEPTSEEPTP